MPSRDWSELPAGAKKFYTDQGITAGPFNRWWRTPQAERTEITAAAKRAGYDSGLQFYAVRAQVETYAHKRITTRTPAQEAGRLMIKGTHGATAKRQRTMTARLFKFGEFDRIDWENFLSP